MIEVEVQASRRSGFWLDVSFQNAARSVGVIGPSGAGKTTLLQALSGFVMARTVRLAIDGRAVVDTPAGVVPPPHRRGIGHLFQDARLFPHMTVAQNVGFARAYAPDPMAVEDALGLVDLDGFADRRPATLSGGEARRVAIARALVARPRLILLDEPFTGLDAARRAALIPYLLRLRDEAGIPLIVVSHHAQDIADLCQDVVGLDRGRRTSNEGACEHGPGPLGFRP